MQVVYSGAVSSAADHFAGLGYRPSGLRNRPITPFATIMYKHCTIL